MACWIKIFVSRALIKLIENKGDGSYIFSMFSDKGEIDSGILLNWYAWGVVIFLIQRDLNYVEHMSEK